MTETFQDKEKYFIEINQYININKQAEYLVESKLKHIVVFCGMGITNVLCDQLNYLSELTKSSDLIIGITDRNDLEKSKLNRSIHKIPMICKEEDVPIGIKAENYLFCELQSIAHYLKENNLYRYEYFTRMRKDIFLILEDFINYLESVPSLNKRYSFITTDQSTNLLRRFCISDQFFTIPLNLINTIPYRIVPNTRFLFWWHLRHIKPHEIFKNDQQMEQWVWINIIKNSNLKLSKDCTYEEYLYYLDKNILVLPTKQIGYLWNRSSDIYFHNWVRYPPRGRGLLLSTKPLRNYTSYSSFISPLLLKEHMIGFLKFFRYLIFLKKLLRFIFTLPLYYLRYLILKR